MLYEAQKCEFLTLPGSGPASFEVSSTIEPHIERTRKSKILTKMLFKKLPIARRKSFVRPLR